MPAKKTLPPHEVVGILADRDPDTDPVATSSYVAEQAGVSKPTALSRLHEVEENEDRVRHAKLGQASVWWLEEDPITAQRAREMFGGGGPHEDVLDAIDADDELRKAVDDVREDGEALDDAVRRLLHEGAVRSTEAAEARQQRRLWAEVSIAAFFLVGTALQVGGPILDYRFPLTSYTVQSLLLTLFIAPLLLYAWNWAAPTLADLSERANSLPQRGEK